MFGDVDFDPRQSYRGFASMDEQLQALGRAVRRCFACCECAQHSSESQLMTLPTNQPRSERSAIRL